MKYSWFKRLGWVYRPVAWQGITIWVLAALFCAQVFLAIDRHSHSVSDTFFGIFPYFASCFLLVNWIASNSSHEPAV